MTKRCRGTALVAGGAGFIGSHLCDRLLADGVEVICVDNLSSGHEGNLRTLLDHPRFAFVEADICDRLGGAIPLDRLRGGAVFNLACPASPPQYLADPEQTLLTCVLGTRNLLRIAETAGARFLQASTSEVYGDPEVHPQREDYWGHVNPNGPRACYDEGKRAAEALVFDFGRARRAQVRVARIFNTYGPRMRADDGRVISNVITQALVGRDVTLYGQGSQTRSFCFVDDMVEGLCRLMALDTEPPGAVNLGNPNEISVAELARQILEMTGSPSSISFHPLPADDPRRRQPDIARAQALLGWTPRVALREGLQATIAWFAQGAHDAAPASGRVVASSERLASTV